MAPNADLATWLRDWNLEQYAELLAAAQLESVEELTEEALRALQIPRKVRDHFRAARDETPGVEETPERMPVVRVAPHLHSVTHHRSPTMVAQPWLSLSTAFSVTVPERACELCLENHRSQIGPLSSSHSVSDDGWVV